MKYMPPNASLYFLGVVGVVLGMALVYITQVKYNLLLPEKNYMCVDAEPLENDPGIVECTVFLRKDSTAHKAFLEYNNDRTN